MTSLIAKTVKKFPIGLPEVIRQAEQKFPHQKCDATQLLLFQSTMFNLLDKLIRQALKDESKIGKSTLKTMLEFEQKFIALSIEKIAMLDSEVKVKARKGAQFSNHKI